MKQFLIVFFIILGFDGFCQMDLSKENDTLFPFKYDELKFNASEKELFSIDFQGMI